MGVKRLWDLLSPFSTPSSPSDWKGKRIAIDASIWVEQFRRAAGVMASTTDECQLVLEGFLRRLLRLIYFGVLPVVVFDGPAPAIKRQEQFRRAAAQDDISARARQRKLEHVIVQRLVRGEIPLPGRAAGDLPTVEEATAMVHSAALQCQGDGEDTPLFKDLDAVVRAVQRAPSTPVKQQQRRRVSAQLRQVDAGMPSSVEGTPDAPMAKRHRTEGAQYLDDTRQRNAADPTALATRAAKRNRVLLRRLATIKEMDDATEAIAKHNKLRSAASYLGPASAVAADVVAAAAGHNVDAPLPAAHKPSTAAEPSLSTGVLVGTVDRGWEVERASFDAAQSLIHWAETQRKSSSTSGDLTGSSDRLSHTVPTTTVVSSSSDEDGLDDDEEEELESDSDVITVSPDAMSVNTEDDTIGDCSDEALSENDSDGSSSVATVDVMYVDSEDDSGDPQRPLAADDVNSVVALSDADSWRPVNLSRAPSITVVTDRDESSSAAAAVRASSSVVRSEKEQLTTTTTKSLWSMRGPQEVATRSDGRNVPLHLVEVVELLDALGIPFVLSPSEADATCGHLSATGQVDAVMTEDSDVFLFGATSVLRGFFGSHAGAGAQAYSVQHIAAADLHAVGLTQARLIATALLMGSDYTSGVTGMTLEHATAILNGFGAPAQFEASSSGSALQREMIALSRFAAALDADPSKMLQAVAPSSDDEPFLWFEARVAAVKRVMRAVNLRHGGVADLERAQAQTEAIRRLALPGGGALPFPSPRVVEAYWSPTVASRTALAPWSTEALQSGNTAADWLKVRSIAGVRCGWSQQDLVTKIDAVRAQCMLRADKDAVADARAQAAAGAGQRRIDAFMTLGRPTPATLPGASADDIAVAVLRRAAEYRSRATGVAKAIELMQAAVHLLRPTVAGNDHFQDFEISIE